MLRYLTCGVVAICALSGVPVDDGMARQIKLTS
jgi:hypothetical protein